MSAPTLAAIKQSNRACLTMAEVAALLEVDARTVSRACADGQLPAVHVGRRTLIPREPLIALLERQAAIA
jgi:excisionase family DNA binding protein